MDLPLLRAVAGEEVALKIKEWKIRAEDGMSGPRQVVRHCCGLATRTWSLAMQSVQWRHSRQAQPQSCKPQDVLTAQVVVSPFASHSSLLLSCSGHESGGAKLWASNCSRGRLSAKCK